MGAAKTKILSSGAGIFAALFVIVLFILAATFLKTLMFGIIVAFFLLPLEKFFERHVMNTRAAKSFFRFFTMLGHPIFALRNRFMHPAPQTPEEKAFHEKESLVLKSTIAAFLSAILIVLMLFVVSASFIVPATMNAGRSINRWASESVVLKNAETKVSNWIDSTELSEEKRQLQSNGEPGGATLREFLTSLRPKIESFIQKNRSEVLSFAFSKSKGVVSSAISLATFIGTFAFDFLLFLFFLIFFLQKMALYGASGEKSNIGEWCVQGIFNTAWLPETTKEARSEAAEIINTICNMFKCWVRGYISIILIETVCYVTFFSIFTVPYAFPLALVAGLTILLPFLGPVMSFVLTVTVCLVFCEAHLLMTLIGVCITYGLINGIMEQLILYPTFVGGAIGLNLIETIIVVLLGGLFAGITGMILAVPAAAILKYLIPKFYELRVKLRNNPVTENQSK